MVDPYLADRLEAERRLARLSASGAPTPASVWIARPAQRLAAPTTPLGRGTAPLPVWRPGSGTVAHLGSPRTLPRTLWVIALAVAAFSVGAGAVAIAALVARSLV